MTKGEMTEAWMGTEGSVWWVTWLMEERKSDSEDGVGGKWRNDGGDGIESRSGNGIEDENQGWSGDDGDGAG